MAYLGTLLFGEISIIEISNEYTTKLIITLTNCLPMLVSPWANIGRISF